MSGVYELHEVNMTVPSVEWKTPLTNYSAAINGSSRSSLMGAWQTSVGRLNQAILLIRYSSLDDALQVKEQTNQQQGTYVLTHYTNTPNTS